MAHAKQLARASSQPKTPTAVRSIDTFGRVSKRVASSSAKKPIAVTQAIAERFLAGQQKPTITIELPTQPPSAPKPAAPSAAIKSKSLKRRASDIVPDDDAATQKRVFSSKRIRRPGNSARTPSIVTFFAQSPDKKASDAAASSSDEGPEHSTRHLLSHLNIQSSSSTQPRSTSSSPRPASTAPTTPYESDNELDIGPAVLPADLADLIHLQTAFAKALALQYAHHGTSVPVDLRVLCPSIAQSWGKRKVTLEDIQRCIGVVSSKADACPIYLSDYSRGKICIELQSSATSSTFTNSLSQSFEANLRAIWSQTASQDRADTNRFIQSLPKAPVKKCASLLQTSALRAKGQRTLEELMHGIALKKQEKQELEASLKAPVVQTSSQSPAQTASPAVALNLDGTPMSLLDRIRYRQLQRTQQQATGAKPLTAEELERRAALHRVCDIADVLSMLCTSSRQQNRVSFGMAAILTKLKDSLRVPISREEGASCVRLLAKEVAPQWIQIVSMGGREIVIMLTEFVPSKTAMESRVQSLQG